MTDERISGIPEFIAPVQVSALIYPFGTMRLAPFILGGGGWYYSTVKGPGNFDDTQNRFGFHAGAVYSSF
jgi:hypothetical protein